MSAPQTPKKAPISIMPSRPMLMTPLRSEIRPPSAREQQRRRVAQHRGEQRRPGDDVARGCSRPTSSRRCRRRRPATAATIAPQPSRCSPTADRDAHAATHGQDAEDDRRHRRADQRRRDRDEEGEEAERDAGPAHARGRQPAAVALLRTAARDARRPAAHAATVTARPQVPPACRGSCGAAATGRSRGCRRSRTARRGPG